MYILQVEVEDRVGLLHDVTQELWACELTVHRAHISTSPADTAVDLFYVTDERNELPAAGRTSVHFLAYFVFFCFFCFSSCLVGGQMGVVHRTLSYAPDFFNFCIHVYTSVCALKEWTSRGRRTVSLRSCVDSCVHRLRRCRPWPAEGRVAEISRNVQRRAGRRGGGSAARVLLTPAPTFVSKTQGAARLFEQNSIGKVETASATQYSEVRAKKTIQSIRKNLKT